VSISAQRRELEKLATKQEFTIVKEYSDVVQSAKDERRPGFQQLFKDLKDKQRTWTALLLLDTSRLSRRRLMAQVFKHEAEKVGVKVLYAKVPESDPIADMVIVGVLEIFDELHSLNSKEKGLAGMAENVRQGYRAGGKAPTGYKLVTIETGAMREGKPVTKSKLEPDEHAPLIKRYLSARAQGQQRNRVKKELALTWAPSTLTNFEWNALTYAGHTVWNVHNERNPDGSYKTGTKRRPRDEWVIKENTHVALISNTQAETLLEQLESSKHQGKQRREGEYLLSGLLYATDGRAFEGYQRKSYRLKAKGGKGRYINCELIENAILERLFTDLKSPEFIDGHKKTLSQDVNDSAVKDTRKQVNSITTQISKFMDMAVKLENPDPVLRKVEELEKKRTLLSAELQTQERELMNAKEMANISTEQVIKTIDSLLEFAKSLDTTQLKDVICSLVERIELNPTTLECCINYRVSAGGSCNSRGEVASPRRSVANPAPQDFVFKCKKVFKLAA
jgi:DNA invertase Pin-like site-specific DNA recombinase